MRRTTLLVGGRATHVTAPHRRPSPPRSGLSSWIGPGTVTGRLCRGWSPNGRRRVGGLEDQIISLYAGGMTIREIQHHLAATLGTDLSHETISNVTEAVMEEVTAWQNRPLEAFYPVIYLDALVVKVRDQNRVVNRHAPYRGWCRPRRHQTCARGSGSKPPKARSSGQRYAPSSPTAASRTC